MPMVVYKVEFLPNAMLSMIPNCSFEMAKTSQSSHEQLTKKLRTTKYNLLVLSFQNNIINIADIQHV